MLRLETNRLTPPQAESRTRMEEYNATARKLNSELEALKQQKSTMKNQIVRTLTSAELLQYGLLVLNHDFLDDPAFQNNLR